MMRSDSHQLLPVHLETVLRESGVAKWVPVLPDTAVTTSPALTAPNAADLVRPLSEQVAELEGRAIAAALQAAKGIYFPDPIKATAGIHVMKVLKALALDVELARKLHPHANGATAMKAMADAEAIAGGSGLIGCTQITEIVHTAGVDLVAPLPKEFELATTYTAAVCAKSTQPESAAALSALMASADTAPLRLTCGFEA